MQPSSSFLIINSHCTPKTRRSFTCVLYQYLNNSEPGSINEACNRQRQRSVFFGDLVDHYKQTELCDRSEWYSEATNVIYTEFLKTWIRPHWAITNIRDIRTIVVENWLRQLRRKDGNPLADTTKTKMRSLMSV